MPPKTIKEVPNAPELLEPLCNKCKLYQNCHSPKLEVQGMGRLGILLLGEAPGETDDRDQKQFISESGVVVDKALRSLNILKERDCFLYNSINCKPARSRSGLKTPTDSQIKYCRPLVQQIINEKKPKLIITLGESASKSVIMKHWKKDFGGITRWRGLTIWDAQYKTWIAPTLDVSTILKNQGKKNNKPRFYKDRNTGKLVVQHGGSKGLSGIHYDFFVNDLKNALECLKKTPENSTYSFDHDLNYYKNQCFILSETEAYELLTDWNENCLDLPVAFDYETTGLKPYDKKQELVTASVCNTGDKAYAFDMRDERVKVAFKRILQNDRIPKIAHNMKYEDNWSAVKLGVEGIRWHWDTMQAAHVEDNRTGYTSLKFLVYVFFGISDYDSEISNYLESDDKRGNSMNRIYEADMFKILMYGALDSLFTYKLAEIQISKMGTKYGIQDLPFFPF